MTDRFETKVIHAGQAPDPRTGAVMTPIYQVSTYAQASPGEHQGYEYSRTDNPTRTDYQNCIAALENARYGLAFSSGMAVADAIMHLLKPGDHVICSHDVYGGTFRLFDKIFRHHGIEFDFVDLGRTENLEAAIRNETRIVWIETPTNPMLNLVDIEKSAKIAKAKGAWVVVDNTFMSPFFQKPIDLGADVVTHSVTKFMNGHSDVIGGVCATNDQEIFEKLKFVQNSVGAVPSPLDCFLVLRGIKTLHLRMERHEQNALSIAPQLEAHRAVQSVIYPGLKSHPQYDLAKTQMSGFGGMITLFLKGGLTESRRFLESVKVFTLAESLGGVESLIEHPAIMTHASIPPESRKELGIHDNLVRLSVGVEHVDDLWEDLRQALDRI